MKRRIAALFLTLIAFSSPLIAQSFRGEVVAVTVPPPEESASFTLTSGKVGVLDLPPEQRFIQGVELSVRTTQALPAPGLFTLVVYSAVDAPDGDGVVSVAGRLEDRVPLGTTPAVSIALSFEGYEAQSVPAGTRVISGIDPNIGAIGVQIVPTGKVMSPDVMATEFEVVVTPTVRPVGALIVTIDGEAETVEDALEILELSVSGTPIEPNELHEFSPGIYRLEASAGDLLSYTANVGIDRAVVRDVTLLAERPRARVRLNVPSVADIFWNGARVTDETMSVEPGVHTVLIRLGDFSLSRRLELEPNEEYEVGIDLDILLKRN